MIMLQRLGISDIIKIWNDLSDFSPKVKKLESKYHANTKKIRSL